MHQHVDEAALRGLAARRRWTTLSPSLPVTDDPAVHRRHLAGDDDEVAGDGERNIVRDRRHRARQCDAEFRQFGFDTTGHAWFLSISMVIATAMGHWLISPTTVLIAM